MRFPLALCAALALSGTAARAAHAQPRADADSVRVLDLPALLQQALTNNPTLQAARLEAEALETQPAQVGALPDPSVMVSYRPLAVASAAGVVPSQVMVQQMIPYPGKLGLAAEAARLGAEAAEADAEVMALDLARDIRDAYYELYLIQEQHHLIQAFIERLRDFEEAAAVRYEVGRGPQQAILKAQVERLNLDRHLIHHEALHRSHVERLARLTNRPDLARVGVQLVLTEPDAFTLDASLGEALAARPEADALRLMLEQADAEIELADMAYKPDFMVGAGIMDMMRMDERVRPLSDVGERFAVQAGIVVPLWRAPKRAAVQEARLRREQIEARMEALETEVETEINDLQARLREEVRTLELYREALIPQAETTVASTLTAYTTGQADFLDLLDAERMLFDLRMDYTETQARYAQTRAALERTLGVDPLFAVQAPASVPPTP